MRIAALASVENISGNPYNKLFNNINNINAVQSCDYNLLSSSSMPASIQKSKQSSGLPSAVSHIYYKHGLFLSSYPTCATSIAIVAILFSW